jgi:hypothetical protein
MRVTLTADDKIPECEFFLQWLESQSRHVRRRDARSGLHYDKPICLL